MNGGRNIQSYSKLIIVVIKYVMFFISCFRTGKCSEISINYISLLQQKTFSLQYFNLGWHVSKLLGCKQVGYTILVYRYELISLQVVLEFDISLLLNWISEIFISIPGWEYVLNYT